MTDAPRSRKNRWEEESRHFDELARKSAAQVKPADPLAVARYSATNLRKRFHKEFRFRILGDVGGKSILDLGCGEGEDSILFASLGAHVTGIDISQEAIDVARKRAEASGVSHLVQFHCSPLETFSSISAPFDIIWGNAILHHLIPELHAILKNLADLAKLDTLVIFCEPINLNHTLRRIRRLIPVHTDATSDERPLERPEIDILRQCIPDLRLRFFGLLGRLDPLILPNYNFERSSLLQRVLSSTIAWVDWGLLSLPFVKNLAGQVVAYGHLRIGLFT